MLRTLADGLSLAEQPLRFLGVPVGARMSIVKLAAGGLLLYSPIAPSDELVAAVAALGDVRLILAPNRFHHLFAGEWQKHAPGAQTWIAGALRSKRADLAHTGILEERMTPFDDDVEHHAIRGAPTFGETVLLHKPSRSLLCCDLVHNVLRDAPFGQRFFMRLVGGYGGVRSNLLDRLAIKERGQAIASLETILAWDFDRIVMAHGTICAENGRAALRNAYGWLLR